MHLFIAFLILISPFTQTQAEVEKKEPQFFGVLSNRYHKVYRKLPTNRLILTDHFRLLFDLGLVGQASPEIDYKAGFEVSKYWNQWVTQNRLNAGVYNFNSELQDQDDTVKLSTAYFNYSPFSWFTLTGGRLNDTFFDKLTLSSSVDGGMLTFKYDSFRVMILYSPYLLRNYNFLDSPTYAKPTVDNGSTEAETLAPMAMFGASYEITNIKLSVFYRWLNYLRFPDSTISESYFDPTLTSTATTSSTLAVFLRNTSGHLEIKNLFDSQIDLNISLLLSQLQSQGRVLVTSGSASGRNLGGYGTLSSDETMNGSVFLISAKRVLPMPWSVAPHLGIEYLNASSGSFYYDGNPEDPTRFYETRGQGVHFYLSQVLSEKLTVRVGHREQFYKWAPLRLGAQQDDTSRVDSYYADFKVEF